MLRAIIFDFDGLIIETEEPSFHSWQAVYASFGQCLTFSDYASMVGTTQAEFDPYKELEKLISSAVDWEVVEPRRRAHERALIEAQPLLPGVGQYIQSARQLGLKTGIASNSHRPWVHHYLSLHGLLVDFDAIATMDDVSHIKPHPEPYLTALRNLQVGADEAFALEDSPIGIRSARAAGLFCVAVPTILTRRLDLSQADYRLESLADMPLAELIGQVERIKTQRAAL